MKGHRAILIAGATIVVLALILLLIYQFLFVSVGEFLMMSDEPTPANTIILSYNATHDRLQHAVDLYEQGYSKKLIVSNFDLDVAGIPTGNSAELVAKEAVSRGVSPADVIVMSTKPTSTYEEAQYLRDLMQQHRFTSALVVAAPYRMRRTILTYESVLGPSIKLVASPSVEERHFNPTSWWKSREGISLVFNEYPRLIFYLVRGRFG